MFIEHILDENGELLLDYQINQKFNLNVNFLESFSLRSAIPHSWKKALKTISLNPIDFELYFQCTSGNFKVLQKWTSKEFYWIFVVSNKIKPTCIERWHDEFDILFTDLQWKNIFMSAFKCTYQTKLQNFQFSLLHRYVSCNSRLNKIGHKKMTSATFAIIKIPSYTVSVVVQK